MHLFQESQGPFLSNVNLHLHRTLYSAFLPVPNNQKLFLFIIP